MDHLTKDQKIRFARKEFSKIVADNNANRNQTAGDDDLTRNQVADSDTINRQEASAYFETKIRHLLFILFSILALLIKKFSFSVSDADLAELIHDEDYNCRQFI